MNIIKKKLFLLAGSVAFIPTAAGATPTFGGTSSSYSWSAFLILLIFFAVVGPIILVPWWKKKISPKQYWLKGLVLNMLVYGSLLIIFPVEIIFLTLMLGPFGFLSLCIGLLIGGSVDLIKKKFVPGITKREGWKLVIVSLLWVGIIMCIELFFILYDTTEGPHFFTYLWGTVPYIIFGFLVYGQALTHKFRQVILGGVLYILFNTIISDIASEWCVGNYCLGMPFTFMLNGIAVLYIIVLPVAGILLGGVVGILNNKR